MLRRISMSSFGRQFFSLQLVCLGLVAGLFFIPVGLAQAADDEALALGKFEKFVDTWMVKLDKVCQENSRTLKLEANTEGYFGKYLCYGPEKTFWIKKIESSKTPFVGYLSYQEKHIVKKGRTFRKVLVDPGQVESQITVTEIFRYTDGHWVY